MSADVRAVLDAEVERCQAEVDAAQEALDRAIRTRGEWEGGGNTSHAAKRSKRALRDKRTKTLDRYHTDEQMGYVEAKVLDVVRPDGGELPRPWTQKEIRMALGYAASGNISPATRRLVERGCLKAFGQGQGATYVWLRDPPLGHSRRDLGLLPNQPMPSTQRDARTLLEALEKQPMSRKVMQRDVLGANSGIVHRAVALCESQGWIERADWDGRSQVWRLAEAGAEHLMVLRDEDGPSTAAHIV